MPQLCDIRNHDSEFVGLPSGRMERRHNRGVEERALLALPIAQDTNAQLGLEQRSGSWSSKGKHGVRVARVDVVLESIHACPNRGRRRWIVRTIWIRGRAAQHRVGHERMGNGRSTP